MKFRTVPGLTRERQTDVLANVLRMVACVCTDETARCRGISGDEDGEGDDTTAHNPIRISGVGEGDMDDMATNTATATATTSMPLVPSEPSVSTRSAPTRATRLTHLSQVHFCLWRVARLLELYFDLLAVVSMQAHSAPLISFLCGLSNSEVGVGVGAGDRVGGIGGEEKETEREKLDGNIENFSDGASLLQTKFDDAFHTEVVARFVGLLDPSVAWRQYNTHDATVNSGTFGSSSISRNTNNAINAASSARLFLSQWADQVEAMSTPMRSLIDLVEDTTLKARCQQCWFRLSFQRDFVRDIGIPLEVEPPELAAHMVAIVGLESHRELVSIDTLRALILTLEGLNRTILRQTTGLERYICPITLERMCVPVIAADGFTYERSAIQEWFHGGKNISPTTGTNSVLNQY